MKRAKHPFADRHVVRLYRAAQNYVERAGGKVIVAGGIQIQQWPSDGEFRFTVAVKCIGLKPEFNGKGKE